MSPDIPRPPPQLVPLVVLSRRWVRKYRRNTVRTEAGVVDFYPSVGIVPSFYRCRRTELK